MSDIHRTQLTDRLDRLDQARDLADELDESANKARIDKSLRKAAESIARSGFDQHFNEAAARIAAMALTMDEDDIATQARSLLEVEDR